MMVMTIERKGNGAWLDLENGFIVRDAMQEFNRMAKM